MSTELTQVGQASAFTEVLTLNVMSASVTVRHENREDIAVHANHPEHWAAASDGSVRQTGVRPLYKDVGLIIQVNGESLGTILRNLWQRILGRVPTTTAEVPAASATPTAPPEPPMGPDELLILVPLNFTAALDMDVAGPGAVELDQWTGGRIKIKSTGDGNINCGDLTGTGSIDLQFYGDGSHNLGNLKSEGKVALTQENKADIAVENIDGDDVTVSLDGGYTITIGDITASGHVDLTRNGDGALKVGNVHAASMESAFYGDGSLALGDLTCEGNLSLTQENSTDITMGNLSGGTTKVEVNGDYGIVAGTIEGSRTMTLNRYGDGSLTLQGLGGDTIQANLCGDGDHDLGRITGGFVTIDHNDGDAGLDVTEVQTTSFTLNHASDGAVDIQRLHTSALNLDCEGCGDVTIRAGSAESGRMRNGGELALSLTGRFGYISHRNEGDGSVEVEIAE